MSQRKAYLLTAVFLCLSGFILGIAFLFLVNVPVEEILSDHRVTQKVVNVVMVVIILAWAGTVIAAGMAFYKRMLLRPERRKLPMGVITILGAASMGLFGVLVSTDNDFLQVWQGSRQTSNSNYSTGPYPEESHLTELKKNGYKGVITLLNPTLPFEKVLLDREQACGKKIGLRIYSFPMLPWVSSNQASLDKIKALVEREEGPFYIHCYLGKHRVDLAEQYLSGSIRNFLYPDHLERGMLHYYQNGRIILGPYPTDEEWFHLVRRGQVKEVISCLDPANPEDLPWIEKEKKVCTEAGLVFKLQPLQIEGNKVTGMAELISDIQTTKNKVYVHTFLVNDKTNLIDSCLRTGTSLAVQPLPESLSGGKLFPVNQGLILGPKPNALERDMLQAAGYNVLSLPLKNTLFGSMMATKIIANLSSKQGACYIYGFSTEKNCSLTRKILQQRLYGITYDLGKIAGDKVTSFSRWLFVGLRPDEAQLNRLATQGIATVIYLSGDFPGKQGDNFKEMVKHLGLNYKQIEYQKGNVNDIVREVSKDHNPCYIIIDTSKRYDIERDIEAAKLFFRPEQN